LKNLAPQSGILSDNVPGQMYLFSDSCAMHYNIKLQYNYNIIFLSIKHKISPGIVINSCDYTLRSLELRQHLFTIKHSQNNSASRVYLINNLLRVLVGLLSHDTGTGFLHKCTN